MNWPDFQRRPRPHPDPHIEAIFVQIDALKPPNLLTPFKPEPEPVPVTMPAKTKETQKPRRTAPTVVFGGKQIK